MGNVFSSVSPPQNISGTIDWVSKSLFKCKAGDLIQLMYKYNYFDNSSPKLREGLIINQISGSYFSDLATLIAKEEQDNVRKERNHLIKQLANDLNVEIGHCDSFIRMVIEKKIKEDIENSKKFVTDNRNVTNQQKNNDDSVESNVYNGEEEQQPTSRNTFMTMQQQYYQNITGSSAMPNNPNFDSITNTINTNTGVSSTTAPSGSTNTLSTAPTSLNQQFSTTFDISKPFADNLLSPWEKQGIQKVIEKLNLWESNLKKVNKTLKDYGITDKNLDAQNSICKDRFKYLNFGLGILKTKDVKKKRTLLAEAYLPVKLIISELPGNEFIQTLRKIYSTVLTTSVYGVFHTSLLIGEWKFDWYDNSLVSVKFGGNGVYSNSPIAVIDVGVIYGKESISEAFTKITDVCCNFNALRNYDNTQLNCQHFVNEILNSLSLTKPLEAPFDRYFTDLSKGENKRKYYFTKSLQKKIVENTEIAKDDRFAHFYKLKSFKFDSNYFNENNTDYKEISIDFNSRKEVDIFCFWLDALKYFELPEGKQDFWLLKAFDRSFVFKNNNNIDHAIGFEVVDFSEPTGTKDCAFFASNGKFEDNSIRRFVYNVQDLVIEPPKR
ncbi:hypothetical protein ABK040_001228 [Willaertia magna]